MATITPFLWFDHQAEEAMLFYVALFPNSRVIDVTRHGGDDSPAFSVSFSIDGQEFQAINGGPPHSLTPGFSIFVSCPDQAEVDRLWSALSEGGEELQCGWVTDRFGLTWQIIPTALGRLLGDRDPERAGRAMQAMLAMKKIDIAALERAATGR